MRRAIILILSIVLLSSPAWAKGKQDKYVPGEVLIKFKESARKENKSRSLMSAQSHREFKRSGIHHLKLKKGESVESAIDRYLADPDVEFVEPNYIRSINAVPNDTYFSDQWALKSTGVTLDTLDGPVTTRVDADIDATDAWDTVTGSSLVVVAVLDTGVDITHQDLAPNIWTNPGDVCGDSFDGDLNGYIDDCNGWDFVANKNTTVDRYGHGTNVAGVVGAVGDNGKGISGVAQNVSIMPVKVLNNKGNGAVADIIAGVEYAAMNGAEVLNASFGGYSGSQAEYNAFKLFCDMGGVIVASAGNDAIDNDIYPNYPSSYVLDCIISVAASDEKDEMSYYTNFGAESVDLAAPGDYILATRHSRGVVWGDDFAVGNISGWGSTYSDNWYVSSATLVYNSTGALSRTISPSVDLSSHKSCGLYFDLDHDIGATTLYVVANSSGSWDNLGSYTGSSAGIIPVSHPLESYEGGTVNIGFTYQSASGADSVNIDNVEVRCTTVPGGTGDYTFVTGTSFAAPLVSGAVALVMSNEPSVKSWDAAWRVKFSSDTKYAATASKSIHGNTLSGGRLNAVRALIPYPIHFSALQAGGSTVEMSWVDRTSDEAGFIVERYTYGTGAYVQLASLPANTQTYLDDTFISGNRYSYHVSTLRGGRLSAHSEIVVIPPLPTGGGGGGGGCFIATAAYGTPMALEIVALKRFRDNYLMTNPLGRKLVALYYQYSPPLAERLRAHPDMRAAVRVALIPLVQGAKRPVESTFTAMGFAMFMVIYMIRKKRRQK
ncbi:S8 family serine peptidase [Nitrospirota bacterium]